MPGTVRIMEHPVGMLAVQVTVRIYHFRLYPDTEIQSQSIDFLDHRLQAVREFILIDRPVTQTAFIVDTAFKPTVVNNKNFNAQIFCDLCQSQLMFFIHIKSGGIPAVI